MIYGSFIDEEVHAMASLNVKINLVYRFKWSLLSPCGLIETGLCFYVVYDG